jgi:predicted NBD/HSP70 family sugar kinase
MSGRTSGPGSLAGLRQANVDRLLDVLRDGEPRSQADLSRASGLSKGLVSGLVQELVSHGELVVRQGVANGRRSNLVAPAPDRQRFGVGVDVGRTHLRVVIGSSLDRVVHEQVMSLDEGHSTAATIDLLGTLIDAGCAEADISRDRLIGVALGVPGPVDHRTGQVVSGAILPGWGFLSLAELAEERLDLPVQVENEANLGAVASAKVHGSQHGLVFVKVGSGVGAGMVLGGRLWHGVTGTAGEFGHLVVDQRVAAVCRCGRRGCLETVTSTDAVRRTISTAFGRDVSFDEAVEMVERGEPAAVAAISEAGEILGRGLGHLAAVVNPAHIVLGGPLAKVGDVLLDSARRGLDAVALPQAAAGTTLTLCPLCERAEALGALVTAVAGAGDAR